MTEIVSKVLTFFVLIGIGFILRRTNLVDDLFTKGVSRFVLYVTLPALIVDSMNFEYSYEVFSNSVILLVAGGVLYLILWFVGLVSSKILKLTGDSRSELCHVRLALRQERLFSILGSFQYASVLSSSSLH
ncbi:MAG: Auxin Efflux Carrier [Mesotoga infera]|uniref:Auxin Efflux Carrier n=1 Tax=Mesotoga infera TaxID=1236046 RepID=A0A101I8D6_9BACT|nr:MAG: Auxin Efflux Carrier [Mesotoga infera]